MVRQGRPESWKDAAPAGITIGGEHYVLSPRYGGSGLDWQATKGDLLIAGAAGAQKILAAPLTPDTPQPLLGDSGHADVVRWGTKWDIPQIERRSHELYADPAGSVWISKGWPETVPAALGTAQANQNRSTAPFIRDETGTVINSLAGWESSNLFRWRWNPTYEFYWRTQLATSARFWAAASDTTLLGISVPTTQILAGFRLDTSIDGNFYTVTSDGISVEAQDTGIAAANTTTYIMWFEIDVLTSVVRFYMYTYGSPSIYHGLVATHSTVIPQSTAIANTAAARLTVENLIAATRHADGSMIRVMCD